MVLLTQFRPRKAVRISRPFCRMPKNPQNLHQPTYSHLHAGLDAESLTLLIYGGAATAIQVIFLGGGPDIESNSLWSFSLPFAFEAMPLAILYSLLWSRSVSEEELINRVRISAVALAVCVAFVLVRHFSWLPHPIR
jgi:hypothetical protein